jgi:uncharacterized protein YkwD
MNYLNAFLIAIICLPVFSYAQNNSSQTSREKQMIKEINLVRTAPKEYIPFVNIYLQSFPKTELNKNKKAANELIRELKQLQPLKGLNFSNELYVTAKAHGKWMKKKNRWEHSKINVCENLVGGIDNPRDALIELLIDEGWKNRGHRKNILNPNLTIVAVYEAYDKPVKGYSPVFIQQFK